MDTDKSRSEHSHRRSWLLGAVFISAIACGILMLAIYNFLDAWTKYDPKQSAQKTVERCIGGSTEACGYIASFPCLADMYRSVSEPNNQYSIDVLWYNQEGEICCRGGDEVYLQVNFTNGDAFKLLWYEGTLEQCDVVLP